MIRFEDVDTERDDHLWRVDNHQLLQYYKRSEADDPKSYDRTNRVSSNYVGLDMLTLCGDDLKKTHHPQTICGQRLLAQDKWRSKSARNWTYHGITNWLNYAARFMICHVLILCTGDRNNKQLLLLSADLPLHVRTHVNMSTYHLNCITYAKSICALMLSVYWLVLQRRLEVSASERAKESRQRGDRW